MILFFSLTVIALALVPGGQALIIRSTPTSQNETTQYLYFHNVVRVKHGAVPLTYSQDLAAKAQQWTNKCKFLHSGGLLGHYGENLAAGAGTSTGYKYSIENSITSWIDEAKKYDSNNPEPSHFTQVVWKGTTEVGCAYQFCDGIFDPSFGKATYYACEYSPAGNVIGQFPENVKA
ncbi:hypothetical protein M422DRAFT_779050 [Sphaerobolus stellatus SS14]|uniref:SCP domain-containing protein n=1 Tax=Sphaerobolus stellatus (strain SS14) TaxID=990650 RepID=A0A0C9VDK0_SPHS4|nr:hypothetical protein M422DRAFT_779050 [Sphaerobolus stellatus SS14]